MPLDIGYAKTIPPAIRNAVILADRRCRWAGGCDQPVSACEVHQCAAKRCPDVRDRHRLVVAAAG